MRKDILAPPIKHKARFKIKDAKCHFRPRNKEKARDSSRQSVPGKALPKVYIVYIYIISAGSLTPLLLGLFYLIHEKYT